MTTRTSSQNNNNLDSPRPFKRIRGHFPEPQEPVKQSQGMLAQTKSLRNSTFSKGFRFFPNQGMRSVASSSRKLESIVETSQDSIKAKYQQAFEKNIDEITKTLPTKSSWRKQQAGFITIPSSTEDIMGLQKRAAAANCKIKDECIVQLNQLKDDFLSALENSQNFNTGNPLDINIIENYRERISDRISQLQNVQNEHKYNLKGEVAGVGKFEEKKLITHSYNRSYNNNFFKIKTDEFFQEIEKIFSTEKNHLQPIIKSSIQYLIASNNSYQFSKLDGIPGLHAEIRVLNLLLKKFYDFKESFSEKITKSNLNQNKQQEYTSKLADISDHIYFSGIRLITVKTRDNAPGIHFKACKNCTGILESLKEIHGITPEVPSGYVDPSMRFKIN